LSPAIAEPGPVRGRRYGNGGGVGPLRDA